MIVLDACALLAYLRREEGWEHVLHLLDTENCCAHIANIYEVFYGFGSEYGEDAGHSAIGDLRELGVVTFLDSDLDFWTQVGLHKLLLRHISLADCICLSLARRIGGEIVTADHHEFDQVANLGLCSVRFIR